MVTISVRTRVSTTISKDAPRRPRVQFLTGGPHWRPSLAALTGGPHRQPSSAALARGIGLPVARVARPLLVVGDLAEAASDEIGQPLCGFGRWLSAAAWLWCGHG